MNWLEITGATFLTCFAILGLIITLKALSDWIGK